jgi:hypothetical protein
VAGDYRPALFIMVGVLAIGFIANLLIRPVDSKFHEKVEHHFIDDDKPADPDTVPAK